MRSYVTSKTHSPGGIFVVVKNLFILSHLVTFRNWWKTLFGIPFKSLLFTLLHSLSFYCWMVFIYFFCVILYRQRSFISPSAQALYDVGHYSCIDLRLHTHTESERKKREKWICRIKSALEFGDKREKKQQQQQKIERGERLIWKLYNIKVRWNEL